MFNVKHGMIHDYKCTNDFRENHKQDGGATV